MITTILTNEIRVEKLRKEIQQPVQSLAEKLITDMGDNFESLTVVGSALTNDFDTKRSDINSVLVIGQRSHKLLKYIANMGKDLAKKRFQAPLLMTQEYIERSLDVFGMEFLDFQLTHATVAGDDPFANLTFQKENVRLQCERELKSALIQLRQSYIRSMGHHKQVGPMLAECVKQLVIVMRTMLWLRDIERPQEYQPTIEAAVKAFDISVSGHDSILTLRKHGNLPAADLMDPMFEDIYQAVDHLSQVVDQMKF
jgi:hypothetical protein